MNTEYLHSRLEQNRSILISLFADVSETESRWTGGGDERSMPGMISRWIGDDRWSLLKIAQHLIVEERDDFRVRLGTLLSDPRQSFPPFQWPIGFDDDVVRSFDLPAAVDSFNSERSRSLRWLQNVRDLPLDSTHENPPDGSVPLRVGDIVAAWIAHDLYHIRQITLLRWAYLEYSVAPFTSQYAGSFADA